MLISNAEFIGELIRLSPHILSVTDNKKRTFLNIAAGVDIETSSFYYNGEKTAIMYEWTFGVGCIVDDEFRRLKTYGRTWEQLTDLLDWVEQILALKQKNRRLIVYIHNLPYEWQFMRKRFSWSKVFFLDDRKPVYAIDQRNIEFRCSLKLSGKSLANTAKDLTKYKAKKMEGDLDYSLIRHSETPLTPVELGYCENDIEVILCYIQEKIEQEGDITRIPLTKTGYVRRYCKRAMFQEQGVSEDEDVYSELDFEAVGVSPDERVLSRWLYPRVEPPRGYDSSESWSIRLYEFLSGGDGSI